MISYLNSRKILNKGKIKIKNETILGVNSLNRVSSKNIYAKFNYPSGDNAAFDGYAINSNDTKNLNRNKSKAFKIIGSISAGKKPLNKRINKFEAVEIMTGGIIPKGFDTIIPIEQIIFYPDKKNHKFIVINKKIDKYNHVRFAGSDFKKKRVGNKEKYFNFT